jgi:hypothetical protein
MDIVTLRRRLTNRSQADEFLKRTIADFEDDNSLARVGLAFRCGANPNLYVYRPKRGNIHLLIYTYLVLQERGLDQYLPDLTVLYLMAGLKSNVRAIQPSGWNETNRVMAGEGDELLSEYFSRQRFAESLILFPMWRDMAGIDALVHCGVLLDLPEYVANVPDTQWRDTLVNALICASDHVVGELTSGGRLPEDAQDLIVTYHSSRLLKAYIEAGNKFGYNHFNMVVAHITRTTAAAPEDPTRPLGMSSPTATTPSSRPSPSPAQGGVSPSPATPQTGASSPTTLPSVPNTRLTSSPSIPASQPSSLSSIGARPASPSSTVTRPASPTTRPASPSSSSSASVSKQPATDEEHSDADHLLLMEIVRYGYQLSPQQNIFINAYAPHLLKDRTRWTMEMESDLDQLSRGLKNLVFSLGIDPTQSKTRVCQQLRELSSYGREQAITNHRQQEQERLGKAENLNQVNEPFERTWITALSYVDDDGKRWVFTDELFRSLLVNGTNPFTKRRLSSLFLMTVEHHVRLIKAFAFGPTLLYSDALRAFYESRSYTEESLTNIRVDFEVYLRTKGIDAASVEALPELQKQEIFDRLGIDINLLELIDPLQYESFMYNLYQMIDDPAVVETVLREALAARGA